MDKGYLSRIADRVILRTSDPLGAVLIEGAKGLWEDDHGYAPIRQRVQDARTDRLSQGLRDGLPTIRHILLT